MFVVRLALSSKGNRRDISLLTLSVFINTRNTNSLVQFWGWGDVRAFHVEEFAVAKSAMNNGDASSRSTRSLRAALPQDAAKREAATQAMKIC